MKRRQNPELLSMIGLGTVGGQPRADGSSLERGIHLRWQMGEDIGFPDGGFDIYRRAENVEEFLKCGHFLKDGDIIVWDSPGWDGTPLVRVTPSGESRTIRGCGEIQPTSLSLRGEQTLRINLEEPARHLRIILDGRTNPTPSAIAFWHSPSGDVAVERAEAQRRPDDHWVIRLFADQIDHVILSGEDMIVCQVCVVLVMDGYDLGWAQFPLNAPRPIYLPITHPQWDSPHAHSPNDQAEAKARLPTGLSDDKQDSYVEGFKRELHDILYDLVGTYPQHLHRLSEQDVLSGATVNWPGLHLLKMIALDPNLARVLGLYWHDEAPPDQYFDYLLIGHYGDTPFPGSHFDYSQLEAGKPYGTILKYEEVTYASPNPIEVIEAEWDGSSMNALFIASTLAGAPLSITLPRRAQTLAIYVEAQAEVAVKGFKETPFPETQIVSAGEKAIVLQAPEGMDTLVIETQGALTIFKIVLRATPEMLEDIVYVSFHHRIERPAPLLAPVLHAPRLVATRTGLKEDGTLMSNQTSVGLHWELLEAGGDYLRPGAPILYHVQRADRGDAEQPDRAAHQPFLLNENAPALISENRADAPPLKSYYIDRDLPDGWYSYGVRGIDIFGRLGEWSRPETIRALESLPPPPPQSVSAVYLDPADPWLSQTDKDWTATNGHGLKVNWEWPGMFRLQAPDVVPPRAEFRIYTVEGEFNSLSGRVNAVTIHRNTSELETDMTWNGAADALVGESLRVGEHFFEINANSSGANSIIEVNNLTSPGLAPEPGACRLVFTRGRRYWTDYWQTENWEKRVHVTPAIDTRIITGRVVSVENYAESKWDLISQPGATRTVITDQSLTDEEGILTPGALLCAGVVYQAYGHSQKGQLKIHIVPHVSPTDSSVSVEPAARDTFLYYPGRRYETYIAGFDIEINPANGMGVAHIAVSCSDGNARAQDNSIWRQPNRGGLGNRPGNEGAVSPACKVMAAKRSLPLASAGVAVASEPIFAKPANYYGQAKYTLRWEAVAEAVGYAIYRSSGAALFDHDRQQRQNRRDYYAIHNVFADDTGFTNWLQNYDSSLSANDLINDAESHLDAWRAWGNRFYPSLSDNAVQELANRRGNEKAFRRVNKKSVEATTYADAFDGRGRGFYLYRVRAIDAANNVGAWSETYPPVHIFNITPPAAPVMTAILGGQNQITIKWAKNPRAEIVGYFLYRTEDRAHANDWRQMELLKSSDTDPYTVEVAGTLPDKEFEFIDRTVIARRINFYCLAAVILDGNGDQLRSPVSACKSGQAYDEIPPVPPIITTLEWIRIDMAGTEYGLTDPVPDEQVTSSAVRIGWTAQSEGQYLLQYKNDSLDDFTNASTWLNESTNSYTHKNSLSYLTQEYRILVVGSNGLFNLDFNVEILDAIN